MSINKNIYIVKIKSGCSENKIENFGNNRYFVKVKQINFNEVNEKLIEMFSNYFGVPKQRIEIISGIEDSNKVLKIN